MLPKMIENRLKRINIKSKRRKILFKKAMELRHLCALEMLVIVKDTEFNTYTIYNSSTDSFDTKIISKLTQPISQPSEQDKVNKSQKNTKIQYITTSDYQKLKRDKCNDIVENDTESEVETYDNVINVP